MAVQTLASVQPPDLRQLLNQLRSEIFFSLNCHQVGTIVSFNAERQTAEIRINILRVVGNQTQQYPLLVDCPVFVNRGGGGAITFPISPGDPCLVHFNDRNIDNWFSTGNTTAPNTSRAHSLSDGFAEVGYGSLANNLSDYSSDSVDLRAGQHLVGIYNDEYSLKDFADAIVTALNALNSAKSGGNVSASITPVQTIANALLK